jgi:adenine/guanine/hypoxanthine permease
MTPSLSSPLAICRSLKHSSPLPAFLSSQARVADAIIIGVLGVTLIAVAFGLEPWHGFVARPPSLAPTFLKMNLAGALNLSLIVIVLTLLLVTILDTAGTLIGVARQAEMLDGEGRLPRLRQALLADSGRPCSVRLGTSTTTAYIESAAGVEEGGRTGLTALVVEGIFFYSVFFSRRSPRPCRFTPLLWRSSSSPA